MTPKEKAKELVENYAETIKPIEFGVILERDWKSAKQCALIAVDLRLDGDFIFTSIEYGEESLEYWQEVKQEIERL
jgi:hypothetical protein